MQKLNKRKAPTVEETKLFISSYLTEVYGKNKHSALKGKTPLQVLQNAKIDKSRLVSTEQLNYLLYKA